MSRVVQTLPELKECIRKLFDRRDVAFNDFGEHQTMFFVEGELSSVYTTLLRQSESSLWSDEDGCFFCYKNEAENISIALSEAPEMVLVIASVLSLHYEYLGDVVAAHGAVNPDLSKMK